MRVVLRTFPRRSSIAATPMSMSVSRISRISRFTTVQGRSAIRQSKWPVEPHQRHIPLCRRHQSSTPFENHPLAGAMARCTSRRPGTTKIKESEKTVVNAAKNAAIVGSHTATTPAPSYQDLQSLFIASSIPMIGFGFMDNFVMIQAGQYIDSTLGVTLGLATLTAAAAGQVVSDVSGVVFGGTLERLLSSWSLVPAISLSAAQRRLPIARNVAMLGAVCGVVMGCTIGALVGLSTTDVAQREREQRDQEITSILVRLMGVHNQDWKLYLPMTTLPLQEHELQQQQLPSVDRRFRSSQLRPLEEDHVAKQCLLLSASKHELASVPSEDGHFLYIPLGKWAVLQCRAEDQIEATQLARHLAIVFETLLPTKP